MAEVNARLAEAPSPWFLRMEYRVPPPMPIIRPLPWIKLYTGMARLSAARPSAPMPSETKKVSAKI